MLIIEHVSETVKRERHLEKATSASILSSLQLFLQQRNPDPRLTDSQNRDIWMRLIELNDETTLTFMIDYYTKKGDIPID